MLRLRLRRARVVMIEHKVLTRANEEELEFWATDSGAKRSFQIYLAEMNERSQAKNMPVDSLKFWKISLAHQNNMIS